ncbi:MAG: hypothetical protein M3R18_06385 [Pseudomonadota bacterium]|nr:hypothetical protein [Pseudomonadota bacterium]
MTILADERISGAAKRATAAGSLAPRWVPLVGILLLAVLLRLIIGTNMDVSWLITVGEKVLDGQRLYVDLIEVNPPASVFLYFPAVLVERAIGLPAEIAVDALVVFAACCSIFLVGRILDSAKLLDGMARWKLAAWTLAVLTILPTRTFSERDHIAVMTLLPFLALLIVRVKGLSVAPVSVLIAGIGAGLTMVIKPHFALPIGMAILAAAVCARSLRPIFAIENWIAGALAALYGALVVIAYPEFIADIVPLVRAVYVPWQTPILALLTSAAVFCWLAALCMLARWKGRLLAAPPYAPLLAASAGFFLAYFIQGKGFPYHAYPMLALAFIAMAFAGGENLRVPAVDEIGGARTRMQRLFAMLPVAAIAVTSAVYLNIAGSTNALIEPIGRLNPQPKMLIITSDLSVGHPLVRQVGGRWVSRVAGQWITAGVFHRHMNEALDADTKSALRTYARRDRDMLAEDIRRQKPDIIVIEREYFDWDAWARSEPVIARELKAYRVAEIVGFFIILQRAQE